MSTARRCLPTKQCALTRCCFRAFTHVGGNDLLNRVLARTRVLVPASRSAPTHAHRHNSQSHSLTRASAHASAQRISARRCLRWTSRATSLRRLRRATSDATAWAVHAHAYARTHGHARTHAHTHTLTHRHTLTHTLTHTHSRARALSLCHIPVRVCTCMRAHRAAEV
jgi:hypothetical protein